MKGGEGGSKKRIVRKGRVVQSKRAFAISEHGAFIPGWNLPVFEGFGSFNLLVSD